MAVTIQFEGDDPQWNASRHTAIEDSTPLDPNDTSGGVGRITFDIPDTAKNRRIRHKKVHLEHSKRGGTDGIVETYGGSNGTISATADSRLILLNVEQTVQPYTGTLEGLFRHYLAACGVTEDIFVDPSIAGIPVTMMGWQGNVWDRIKRLCTAYQVEVALVSGIITMRPPRSIVAQTYRDADGGWTVDDGELAQTVEIRYFPREYRTDGLVYPTGGWNEDVQVYSVEAGDIEEVEIKLSASLASIDQPVCVSSVDVGYIASSVYCVAGNDGLIIPPAQWAAGGGKIEVEIGEDTRSIILRIHGSAEEEYAPYRIMMPSGTNEGYSSLRLVGTGVFFEEETLVMIAHPDPVRAPEEVGATVLGEELETRIQAFTAGLHTAGAFSGPRKKIDVTTKGIGPADDPTGDLQYGNIAGARVRKDGTFYRIRTNTSGTNHKYMAESDTTVGDLKRAWRGRTVSEWNEFHAGVTAGEFKIAPLDAPEQPLSNVYPDLWYPDQVYPA